MRLFADGDLRGYLDDRLLRAIERLEEMPEDEVLDRTTDSIVEDLVKTAGVEPPRLLIDDAVGGAVDEVNLEVTETWSGRRESSTVRGTRVRADYAFEGDPSLLRFKPSTFSLRGWEAEIGREIISIYWQAPGTDHQPEWVRDSLRSEVEAIAVMVRYVANDVEEHNRGLDRQLRAAVENRKQRLLSKRSLSGALGFPVAKHANPPRHVPIERKVLGVRRRLPTERQPARTYRDEYALAEADYEDVVSVLRSMLLACERAPATVTDKSEEAIRDLLLIQLNGTFKGTATGETFIAAGKTDILVRVEDKHVFVGECKWWQGPVGFTAACDQLLSYLPWRDEKAALLIFIKNKNASKVIEAADETIRLHPQFVRAGNVSDDPAARRNYILRHAEDQDREIQVAVLFAVIRDRDADAP